MPSMRLATISANGSGTNVETGCRWAIWAASTMCSIARSASSPAIKPRRWHSSAGRGRPSVPGSLCRAVPGLRIDDLRKKRRTKPSMRGPVSSEAVQILRCGFPAHPLRRRLRSIWPISDLSADEVVVHPATHPLSPRPRESSLPLNADSVRSVDRRDVIRSTIYSGSPDRSDVAIKPESKGRHHSISRQPVMGPLSGFVAGSSSWSSRPPAFARQVARSHRGWVRFTPGSRSFPGSRRPSTSLRFAPGTIFSPTFSLWSWGAWSP